MNNTIDQELIVLSPDGFPIDREETYTSQQEAIKAAKKWVRRYKSQGYYSSPKYGRIPYGDILEYCTLSSCGNDNF